MIESPYQKLKYYYFLFWIQKILSAFIKTNDLSKNLFKTQFAILLEEIFHAMMMKLKLCEILLLKTNQNFVKIMFFQKKQKTNALKKQLWAVFCYINTNDNNLLDNK